VTVLSSGAKVIGCPSRDDIEVALFSKVAELFGHDQADLALTDLRS